MRIAFVTSRFPYPITRGDQLRAYHQVRLLSQRHRITLFSVVDSLVDEEALASLRPFVEDMRLVSGPEWERVLGAIQSACSGLPLQVGWFCSPSLTRSVRRRCSRRDFDLVHIQLSRLGPVGAGIQIPKVMDMVDALSLNMQRRARTDRSLLSRLWAMEARRMKRYERRLLHAYDQIVVVAAEDCRAVGVGGNVWVIPNGVDLEVHPWVERNRKSPTIIFTGQMGYFPNFDAAIYLLTRLLPIVRARIPDVRVMLVGAGSRSALRRWRHDPGVLITGRVPALREYFARATVAVAPLRCGSGMQNKVLEAMASGVPVVATAQAVAGIEGYDGVHFLVGHNEEELADCIARVIEDRRLGDYLACNARRLVEERYTWQRSVSLLEEVYSAACR